MMPKWNMLRMFLVVFFFCISGCGGVPPTPAPTSTSTDTSVPVTPDNTAVIASDINKVVATTLPLGLIVIPDQTEAKEVATLSKQVIDTNILPILNGDDAGLVAALPEIMSLNAFNGPKLSKVKLLLELALPFLTNHLPADLVSGQTNKINPTVKLYLIAFFTGADKGLGKYLGDKDELALAKDFQTWAELRAKLEAK